MGNVIFYRGGASRLLGKKLVVHQQILGAVLSTLLFAACAATQNPTSLSVSSASSSTDIVIRRSAVAPNAQLANSRSPAVDKNNGTSVDTVIDADNVHQRPSTGYISNGNQHDAAARVIDTIIWQIQTGPVPSSPVDPVVPEGQDPSLTEDALGAAFAMLSNQAAPPSLEPEFKLPSKQAMQLRVGLLVPLTGPYAAFGDEIRRVPKWHCFKQ